VGGSGEADVGAEEVVEGGGFVEPGMQDSSDTVVERCEAKASSFCG